MNNITVFSVLVILFFAQSAFAQEFFPARERGALSHSVSLRPVFGVMHGHSDEIVFPDSTTKGELLSLLTWDMKPVFYYGFQMNFSPAAHRGFFANVSLKFGIPGFSGNMENRDWQSTESDMLTDFSVHDNYTREMFLFDLAAGYSIPVRQFMRFNFFANISFMRFRFSGFGGHGIYSMDRDPQRFVFYGRMINYTQEWVIFSPGVSLNVNFFNNFYLCFSFQISPLISAAALDEHLHPRNTQFRDFMRGGIFIKPGASLSWSLNGMFSVSLDFSWRYISGTKGDSFQRPYGTGHFIQLGTAGAGLSVFSTGLLLNIRL